MNFQKGDLLNIDHKRKGLFKAIAASDFSTEDQWYPIVVAPGGYVKGASVLNDWFEGESIPCRASLVTLILKEEMLENPDA